MERGGIRLAGVDSDPMPSCLSIIISSQLERDLLSLIAASLAEMSVFLLMLMLVDA